MEENTLMLIVTVVAVMFAAFVFVISTRKE